MSVHSQNEGFEPLISVVLCTRNRADLLKAALDSLLIQKFPPADFEVLVIDNASTDHTAKIVAQYDGIGIVRYIHEPNIGLCIARNTGWQSAHGRLVAYFDDDAIAAPGWLAAVQAAFAAHPSEVGVVGGRVDPIWQKPMPAWLAEEIAYSLTIVDWGDEVKFIDDLSREWLVGANMAIPRQLLAEIGGFHPWLDRVGTNMLSSGDVFLQKEIKRRGYRCLYWPEMAIQHLAPAARLEPQWFLRRYYWQGVSDAVMFLIEHSPTPADRTSIAADRSHRLHGRTARIAWPLTPPKNRDAFAEACFALVDAGFVAGMLGAAGH
jgi:glucosyl-dolichyl phosphate glucuronosyltransferase